MPYMNLWGINPLTKKASSYISHVQYSERLVWEQKAKNEGWTQLTWGIWGDHSERDSDGTQGKQLPRKAAPAKDQPTGKQSILPKRIKAEIPAHRNRAQK